MVSVSEGEKTALLLCITNLRFGRGARRLICFINADRKRDDTTHRVIDVEQQMLVSQNKNEDFGSLMEELATLQSERKVNREDLGFKPIKKGPC